MSDQRPSGGYLLAISIGPVQEFIAASRKARDLWYGSALLSDLSRHAATNLHDPGNVELIFPDQSAVTTTATLKPAVANKLLVHVKHGDPAALAHDAKKEATALLRVKWNDVWNHHRLHERLLEGLIDTGLLYKQLDDFIEWYAAWIPYDPSNQGSYKPAREQLELLLAGRKALRDFRPAHGRDRRPKSSLDPSRESVILYDLLNRQSDDVQRTARRRVRLKGNEQLDGISLLKRLGGTNRLVSVSRVAVDPYIRRAVNDGYATQVANLRAIADKLKQTELAESFNATRPELTQYTDFPFDCQLFYARGATDVDTSDLALTEIEDVDAFCTEAGTLTTRLPSGPPTYFAVIAADGDRMGKALGTLLDPDHHRIFSEGLAAFASGAGATVQRHNGAMIYSGGDDVLAFLPLDTALPCAYALKKVFETTITSIWKRLGDDVPEPDQMPTLSVGVAVGHYAEHLQVLLDRARKAEKDAKVDRNSLAVSFTAHSGGGDTRTVVHDWGVLPVRDRWWFAINAFHLDLIPDGVVYELGQLHRELAPLASNQSFTDAAPSDFVAVELTRILNRKRVEGGRKRMRQDVVDKIIGRLDGDTVKDQIASLKKLIDELFIARRFLPAVVLGGGDALPLWTDATNGPGVTLTPPRDEAGSPSVTEGDAA